VSAVLANNCILVSFSGAYYHWLRRDTLASAELAASKGINKSAFLTFKNIFLGADEKLTEIQKLVNNARQYHTDKTIASPFEGYHVLPNTEIEEYRTRMNHFQMRLENVVAELKREWPTMISSAATALGPAFAKEAYPDVSKVVAACSISYRFAPMPSPDGFDMGMLDPKIADELKAALAQEVNQANAQAVVVLGDGLMSILENAKTNLQKGKGSSEKFRTEWHQNLADFLPKIMAFLGQDNPAVAALGQRIENFLATTSPKELRENPVVENKTARESAVTKLDEIIGDFKSMFGEERA
jgi:hypothetical protein